MLLCTIRSQALAASAVALFATSAVAQPFFRASCDNRQGTTFADVVDASDPAQNGYNIDPSEIYRGFPAFSFPSTQSISGASASASLVVNSQFFGANPGTRTSGFRAANTGSITLSRTSGNATVRAQSSDTTSVCLTLSGASTGSPAFWRVVGNLNLSGGSTGFVRFTQPGGTNLVNLTANGSSFNRVLRLTSNGDYDARSNFDTGLQQRSTNGTTTASGSSLIAVTCIGDFNGSGSTTTQDIFDFLAAWFGNNLSADANANNSVTVQDVFDFLQSWFAGCV